jgi:methylenetetrahydrofolate dehydrogenase (NADP+)/methenyltetrahydrofolate cyclohydrolase
MAEKILLGTGIARQKLDFLGEELQFMRERFGFQLRLAVISLENYPTNQVYLNNLQRAAVYCGIEIREFSIPHKISEKAVLKIVKRLSNNHHIHGILIQEPVLTDISGKKLMTVLDPDKDVDCVHLDNRRKALAGTKKIYPGVVTGILEMLKHAGIALAGTEIAVVHRCQFVSKLIATALAKQQAKVKTFIPEEEKLKEHLRQGEIVICGISRPKYINGSMVKNDAVVLDVGFNVYQNNLIGDVNLEDVITAAKAVTPVPGGIGPLAVSSVLEASFLNPIG